MPNTREKLIELLSKVQYQGNAVHGFHDKYIQNSELADHLIANGVTLTNQVASTSKQLASSEWIPVAERLPKPFTPVLVYRQSFGTLPPYIKVDKMTLWYDDTQVWTDEVGNWKNVTTHWMPLPQPPKGE